MKSGRIPSAIAFGRLLLTPGIPRDHLKLAVYLWRAILEIVTQSSQQQKVEYNDTHVVISH